MSNTWIFQCNPKMYDIDGALEAIDEIWWTVPQHTAHVHAGDRAIIWRSGDEAGIVAVGRVASEPAARTDLGDDHRFYISPPKAEAATRVLLQVTRCPFVPKAAIAELGPMEENRILTAPLGTVFRVSEAQWASLSVLVPESTQFEVLELRPEGDSSSAFAWGERISSCQVLPGGYDSYLESGRAILEEIDTKRPTQDQLVGFIMQRFDSKPTSANAAVNGLRGPGFIGLNRGSWELERAGQAWLERGDPVQVVTQLHKSVRFVGEMLAQLIDPKSTSDLLEIANLQYGMSWKTETQLHRRRGWLQSAGMLAVTDGRQLVITEDGRKLVESLDLAEPLGGPPAVDRTQAPTSECAPGSPVDSSLPEASPMSEATRVSQELEESATISSDPDRFERAVRDAFQFLGFDATWLGGSGKTDVLLQADIGRGQSYRVVVDAKSTATGNVKDTQVDWITLRDHQVQHQADYIALVGPDPTGQRLFDRAAETGVAVLSVERLASLVHQHDTAPLGLADYRRVFNSPGEFEPDSLAELADDWLRIAATARIAVDEIRRRATHHGPLTARELSLVLHDNPSTDGTTEEELGVILATLASPLLGVLQGESDSGFVATSSDETVRLRLDRLAALVVGESG